MANRIVYSCNSSDMDVSDTDDGLREESLPSIAQVVAATSNMDISDSDSDASFHTADNSPRQHFDELEPGQISDASPITYPDPLETECQVLETQLQENNNRIASIDRKLKTIKEREEQIKIRLLENQVRNSIARNRRPVRRVNVTPVTTPHSHPTTVEETQTDRSSTTPSTRPDVIPSTNQRMDVESHSMPQQTMVSQNCESHRSTAHHLPTISQPSIQHLGTAAHLSKPVKVGNSKTKRRKRQRRRIRLRETSGSDTSTTDQPSSSRIKRSKPSVKDIIKISEGCSGNQRLMQAVIDVPLSARYVYEMEKANASDNDDDDDDDDDDVDSEDDEPVEPTAGNKGKGKGKGKEKADPKYVISDEELALIATDIPPYPPKSYLIPREEHMLIVKSVRSHLTFNAPSLKIMRINLLNLQETAIKQDHQLSCHQEELAKALIRKILRIIEDYMILPEEVYRRPSRLHPYLGDAPARLPEYYYGNLGTAMYAGPDVSHYELYKAVQYFRRIVSKPCLRKIDQLLLKTGRMPQQRILRTCDPANPDRTSNIPIDLHMRNNKEIQEKYRQLDLETDARDVTRKPKETKRQKKKRLLAEEQEAKKQKARLGRAKKAGQKPMQLVDEVKIEQGESSQCAATATAGNTALNDPDEFDINQLYDFYANKVKQEPVDPQDIERLLYNPPILTSPPPAVAAPAPAVPAAPAPAVPAVPAAPAPAAPAPAPAPAAPATPATAASIAPPAPPAPPADISLQMYDMSPKVTEVPASTPTITQSNPQPSSTHFHPYKSALSSLGLTDTPKLNNQPKISTLCSAESSGGVCNVVGCRYTHFSDYT